MGTFRAWLESENQFAHLGARCQARLFGVYVQGAEDLVHVLALAPEPEEVEARLKWLFARHQVRLARLAFGATGGRPSEVVSGEYDPALQLAALSLEGVRLTGPLLDIGCGRRASLVNALRANGCDAQGLDRHLGAHSRPDLPADWLEHDFGHNRYGFVVSHLGLSLNLLYHHRRGSSEAYSHVATYMRVLESLSDGGVFAYVPSVPFLEDLLPARLYRVERFALPARLATALKSLGLPRLEATHVTRASRS
jgi:hypothetical protein